MTDTRKEITTLLPCPFCGGQASISENELHNGRVYCDCINDDGTVGKETWNKRV